MLQPLLLPGVYIFKTISIDDFAFELFAKDCGIGRGIRQKKIPQEK